AIAIAEDAKNIRAGQGMFGADAWSAAAHPRHQLQQGRDEHQTGKACKKGRPARRLPAGPSVWQGASATDRDADEASLRPGLTSRKFARPPAREDSPLAARRLAPAVHLGGRSALSPAFVRDARFGS